jgi:hypothetical protein
MEVRPITVYVWSRTLEGIISTFEVSELNAFFDKALQTVFEKPFNEVMSQPYNYSKSERVNFKPSQSTYLVWCKLPKEVIPYVMEAFNRVLSHMLNDYIFSRIEEDYKELGLGGK